MYEKPAIIVGLVGPVNGGKSAVTNALANDLVSKMGPFRTTIIPEVTGENIPSHITDMINTEQQPNITINHRKIKTDDQDEIIIIELPGVFCGDESNSEVDRQLHRLYTDAVDQYVPHMDIVYWVTDIRTAFITAHEMTQFTKIATMLTNTSTELVIMLSKYEYRDPSTVNDTDNTDNDDTISCNTATSIFDTSISMVEDIAIDNHYKKLIDMEELKQYTFIKFNQFGRLGVSTSTINTEFRLPIRPIDFIKRKQDAIATSIIGLIDTPAVPVPIDPAATTDTCLFAPIDPPTPDPDTTDRDIAHISTIIQKIDLLIDMDAIEKVYKYLINKPTTETNIDVLCFRYFTEGKNSVFKDVDPDLIPTYPHTHYIMNMRISFLLGLDTLNGLRKYYTAQLTPTYVDILGTLSAHAKSFTCTHVSLSKHIQSLTTNHTKTSLLSRYDKYDACAIGNPITKRSDIERIEQLNIELWGNDDDRDIRALITHKYHQPNLSLFRKLN